MTTIPRSKIGNIKGENVTLDFDAPVVSPETLKQAVSAFMDLLIEVSAEVGHGTKILWNVSVEKGSRLFIARPANASSDASSNTVIKAISSGLKALERGTAVTPTHFNDRALNAAKRLAMLRGESDRKLNYLRIRSVGKPCEISSRTTISVDRLVSGQRQAYGTLEGKLQTLTERGGLQFTVYDDLFDKGVNCFLEEGTAQSAVQAFGRRVAVSGLIQYDKEGRPVSIRVETIRIFKDVSELPPIKSLRGIFKRAEA